MNDKLLEGVKSGDPAALTEIYRQMRPKLVKWVAIQTRDNRLAEDLTNEAFIKLLRYHDTIYGDGEQLIGWLYSTTHRVLLDYLRKRKRRVGEELGEVHEKPTLLEPADFAVEADEIAIVGKMLEVLTEHQFTALTLKMYGFSRPEIARRMTISTDAANQLVMRAQKKLRRQMVTNGSIHTNINS